MSFAWRTIKVLTAASLLLLTIQPVLARLLSNVGFMLLSRSQVPLGTVPLSQASRASTVFALALRFDAGRSAHRGLGFAYWFLGEEDNALSEWSQANYEVYNYVRNGASQQVHYGNVEEALRWYRLSEEVDSSNRELWRYVGRICQNQPAEVMCARFLTYNAGNWLVDSEFEFGQAAWRLNRAESSEYGIVQCPEMEGRDCAYLRATGKASDYGATWYQCLHLSPGQHYSFSAWVKVDAPERVQWRPLYFQGQRDDRPRGYWSGTQSGPTDWGFWERTFVAPELDRNWACFHPIRVSPGAQAWFHSAQLKLLPANDAAQ